MATVAGMTQRLFAVGSILIAYRALERIVDRAQRLPEQAYQSNFFGGFAFSAVLPSASWSIREAATWLTWLLAALAAAIAWRQLIARWPRELLAVRIVSGLAVGVLAWYFSTYSYNFFFDQWHLADRVLLVALAAAALWRPVFLFPFVVECGAIMGQLDQPVAVNPSAQPLFLIRLAVFVFGFWGLRSLLGSRRIRTHDLTFVALAAIAASYVAPGIGKFELGQPFYGSMHHLLFNTYANGWAGFLSVEQIEGAGRFLAAIHWLLEIPVLCLEIGILLMFRSRRFAVFFLVYAACFHVAVFAMSGICFWMWGALELTLAWLLCTDDGRFGGAFSRADFALSIPLILFSVWWFRPISLSWLDPAANYTYRLEGESIDGKRYSLPPSSFAPYEFLFTMGQVREWSRDKTVSVMWGATADSDFAWRLLAAPTPETVRELEEELGEIRYDAERAATLDRFVATWVSNQNSRLAAPPRRPLLKAPPQVVTFARRDAYDGSAAIQRVRVTRVTSLFDGERYQEFDYTVVRTIEVPD